MSERQAGWYHIKTGAGWGCAEWDGKQWYITGSVYPYADNDFTKIGARIPTPDEPWQCVPVDMTPPMRRAGQHALEHQCYIDGIYADIIAASPRPGGGDGN